MNRGVATLTCASWSHLREKPSKLVAAAYCRKFLGERVVARGRIHLGKTKLIGSVHTLKPAATAEGGYWQAWYFAGSPNGNWSAEPPAYP